MQLSCMAGLLLQIGRRTVTLDTGLRPARLARSEISPDCIIGSTRPDTTPRRSGEAVCCGWHQQPDCWWCSSSSRLAGTFLPAC